MTLTDFLLARIAEDEAVAREARGGSAESWQVDARGSCDCCERVAGLGVWVDDRQAPHVARHDPARVLAECEAKRRIVEAHREWDDNDWQAPAYFSAPMDLVLSLLALPYADHPDYREEWKP